MADGWYNANDVAAALRHLSHETLTLKAGVTHRGRPARMTWQQTLASQSFTANMAPFLLLALHPETPQSNTHVVCAIRKAIHNRRASWYLLDSRHPGGILNLENPAVARQLDADVYFVDRSDPMVASPALPTRHDIITALRQANTPTSTPCQALANDIRLSTTKTCWPGPQHRRPLTHPGEPRCP